MFYIKILMTYTYEDPDGKYRYSYTFSLNSVLDGVGGRDHVSAALPLRKTRYPLYRRLYSLYQNLQSSTLYIKTS